MPSAQQRKKMYKASLKWLLESNYFKKDNMDHIQRCGLPLGTSVWLRWTIPRLDGTLVCIDWKGTLTKRKPSNYRIASHERWGNVMLDTYKIRMTEVPELGLKAETRKISFLDNYRVHDRKCAVILSWFPDNSEIPGNFVYVDEETDESLYEVDDEPFVSDTEEEEEYTTEEEEEEEGYVTEEGEEEFLCSKVKPAYRSTPDILREHWKHMGFFVGTREEFDAQFESVCEEPLPKRARYMQASA